jgi:hypothetical protein
MRKSGAGSKLIQHLFCINGSLGLRIRRQGNASKSAQIHEVARLIGGRPFGMKRRISEMGRGGKGLAEIPKNIADLPRSKLHG